ncbi:MAG: septal ring lytic transglycosylase RlpA family protein [Alphaproteobacteria bacterium]|nr:septal ring lytic transglycosylase RlpA family protein [Alphaproteobacteria bacterium]
MLVFLSGCASKGTPELSGLSPQAQAVAIKNYGGVYKVGKPYEILDKWYYPKEDYTYSEVGMASWYGKDFHAKKTANGEIYDMNTLTAAHRTLPLPSIVRVTNLENGRSLVLRVNDRGPYAKDRIIDISKRGAQLLGYQTKGITKVRVDILAEESKALKAALLGQKVPDIEPVPVMKTSTSEENSTNTTYYVQAGSFSQKHLATNLYDRLSKFGQGEVNPVDVNGSTFYRVKIGPFSYQEEADVMLGKIRDYGIYDARIVKN